MLYARSVLRNRLDFKRLRLQIKILILKFYFLPFTKWRVQLKELSVHGISFNIMFTHLNFHKREICRSQIILTGSGKYNRLWKSINPAEMDKVPCCCPERLLWRGRDGRTRQNWFASALDPTRQRKLNINIFCLAKTLLGFSKPKADSSSSF